MITLSRFIEDTGGGEGQGWSQFWLIKDGVQVAWAIIDHGRNYIDQVFVDEEWRKHGFASLLYDYIEFTMKVKLVPSGQLSSDGECFWKSRGLK